MLHLPIHAQKYQKNMAPLCYCTVSLAGAALPHLPAGSRQGGCQGAMAKVARAFECGKYQMVCAGLAAGAIKLGIRGPEMAEIAEPDPAGGIYTGF